MVVVLVKRFGDGCFSSSWGKIRDMCSIRPWSFVWESKCDDEILIFVTVRWWWNLCDSAMMMKSLWQCDDEVLIFVTVRWWWNLCDRYVIRAFGNSFWNYLEQVDQGRASYIYSIYSGVLSLFLFQIQIIFEINFTVRFASSLLWDSQFVCYQYREVPDRSLVDVYHLC